MASGESGATPATFSFSLYLLSVRSGKWAVGG